MDGKMEREKEEGEEIRSLTLDDRNTISVCDNNSMKSFNTKNQQKTLEMLKHFPF